MSTERLFRLFQTILEQEQKNLRTRVTDIIENEYSPELPRLFQVEQCKVEDKLPDICESIPKTELMELCKKAGNGQYEFWPSCRKTCDEVMGGKVDYTSCLTTEYPCVDGFCLSIYDGLGDNKPDCIDARYMPEIKYKMDEQVIDKEATRYTWGHINGIVVQGPGIPEVSGNARNDCGSYGFIVGGDYRYQCMDAPAAISPVGNLAYGNCDSCNGAGVKTRYAEINIGASNAGSSKRGGAQSTRCREKKELDKYGDLGLRECVDIDENTPKETYSGYLDFNGLVSKKLIHSGQYAGNIGTRGLDDMTKFAPSFADIQTFSSADEAMAACIKVSACCGITYSKAYNWTLRNGGFVKRIDKTDNLFGRQSEHRKIFGEWEVNKKSNGSSGIVGHFIEAIWGSVSFRKECFGNKTGFCKDRFTSCKIFKETFCGPSEDENYLNCLETCGICSGKKTW